jgi:restriction endonuclease Mrr
MTIPTFQVVMRPLLELAADGKELRTSEAVGVLADQFHLTKEEREELLPSGRQRRFNNRVAWATAYFRATGLFVSPGRGRYTITDRGRQVPDNCDRDHSLRYNPMFYPLHGSDEIDTAFVNEAVRAMAADSFEDAPGDQRLKDLDTSLANMSLVAPESRKGARH